VAAGIGGTAEAVLSRLGPDGRVVCVERAAAMRERGAARVRDSRVSWRGDLPETTFDRVLVGAAIWTMLPLAETLAGLAARVAPGGALALDLPAAYLGEPDEPGGGDDPWLAALPDALAEGRALPDAAPWDLPDAEGLAALLRDAGLRPERWEIRTRFTQAAYRDWLKLPPVSDRLLAGVEPEERAALVDGAFERVDPDSWRWERWAGYTAWASR